MPGWGAWKEVLMVAKLIKRRAFGSIAFALNLTSDCLFKAGKAVLQVSSACQTMADGKKVEEENEEDWEEETDDE
jgi:hypothetical protein